MRLWLALALSAGSVWAAPDMAKPPEVGALVPYRAPRRESFVLSNGVPVLLVTDRRFPLVTVRLALRGGSASVPARYAGLAHAMAELLTEGTSHRSALDIAREADAIGGAVSASADKDSVVVGGFALSENLDRLLALVSETALDPAFPEDEVALRKRNMLEELKISRADPDFLASVALHKKLFPDHPYGLSAPTEDSIARIDREALRALHKKIFVPANGLMVVVGDVDRGRLQARLEERFRAWRPLGELPSVPVPAPRARPGRRLALFDRPGSAQAVLALGNIAAAEKDPDYFPLLAANQILGGSFAARLNADLREEKGYTYGISSWLEERRSAGAFVVSTQVRSEVTRPTIDGVLGHLERMRAEPVSESELAQAKNMLAGRFARRLETQAGVADGILHGLLQDLPPDALDTYLDKVRAVSAADVRRAARAHMRPEDSSLAVVGDAAALKGQLDGLAPEGPRRVDLDGDDLP